MKLNSYCMLCTINRQGEKIAHLADETVRTAYMKAVFKLIAEADVEESSPEITAKIHKLYESFFGKDNDYTEINRFYNELMLGCEDQISKKIYEKQDTLLEAVKYARTGNYIDFSALKTVDNERLMQLIADTEKEVIDQKEYTYFCDDLQKAERVVYITDNSGEIVLDKLLIQNIKEKFPHIEMTVIVRGGPAINDATIEDAKMTGLTDIVHVIGNGAGVAGTPLNVISDEAKEKMEQADVVISKGQGNFETLYGCGLNIYYIFLCKCDLFVKMFGMKRFEGVFVNENRCTVSNF